MASHHAPPGHSKVSLNLRTAIWRGDATGNQGIADACKAQGIDPVALIEALLLRYLNGTEQERRRMEGEASREMRARRQLAAVLRTLERSS